MHCISFYIIWYIQFNCVFVLHIIYVISHSKRSHVCFAIECAAAGSTLWRRLDITHAVYTCALVRMCVIILARTRNTHVDRTRATHHHHFKHQTPSNAPVAWCQSIAQYLPECTQRDAAGHDLHMYTYEHVYAYTMHILTWWCSRSHAEKHALRWDVRILHIICKWRKGWAHTRVHKARTRSSETQSKQSRYCGTSETAQSRAGTPCVKAQFAYYPVERTSSTVERTAQCFTARNAEMRNVSDAHYVRNACCGIICEVMLTHTETILEGTDIFAEET